MKKFVKVTSKKQITIPSTIFEDMGIKKDDYLLFEKIGDKYQVSPVSKSLAKLAGSIKVDKKLSNVDLDEAIRLAKEERFSSEK